MAARIRVLSLGGTIAMTPGEDAGLAPTLTARELIAAVPKVDEIADLLVSQFRLIPGAHLSVDDVVALAHEVDRSVSEGADGVVIVQGTDTIEEVAFALDVLLGVSVPVVVTGAMRAPDAVSADGPANVLAAIQVASHAVTHDLGVLVVFNNEIHAAEFVRKRHTSSLSAFVSEFGPIGWLSENEPIVAVKPERRRPHLSLPSDAPAKSVALVKVALGDDERLLGLVSASGFDGLVVEAMGGGHVPSSLVAALSQLTNAIPVVLASRTGGGAVLQRTYGFPGSEMDLIERGLIPAGRLDGLKARLLLLLLLRGLLAGGHPGRFRRAIVVTDASSINALPFFSYVS